MGVTEVWRSDVDELEGPGAGSMLRASEGGSRGPSAGFWVLEGAVRWAARQAGDLRVRWAVGPGLSLAAIRQRARFGGGFVRGAEMPRSVRDLACEGFHTVAEMLAEF